MFFLKIEKKEIECLFLRIFFLLIDEVLMERLRVEMLRVFNFVNIR